MTQFHLPIPNGETIPYTLERRTRKTVGLKINHNGLIVHAPTQLSQKELERVLLSKADWIVKKLQAQQENQLEKFIWEDGAPLLLLGNTIELSVRLDSVSRALEYEPGRISVALPTPNNQTSIARKVLQWYKKQALTDFSRRIALLAAKLGVETPPLFLSSARSRWGSCNSRGEVRLNWRLLQAPPHIVNYVVAHELAHLKEMNHSAKFWATVARIYPDYKTAEKELKTWSAKLHRI
ncbi:MAG: M48 family metallopeptidase [Burkholderiaceae bacterium]|nr:M48 family metallopeptidase [Burkholderiaceae bacterium]